MCLITRKAKANYNGHFRFSVIGAGSWVRFSGQSNQTLSPAAAMLLRSCVAQALSYGDWSRHLLHALA